MIPACVPSGVLLVELNFIIITILMFLSFVKVLIYEDFVKFYADSIVSVRLQG